ncbi:MAG TPA: hypothetical protein PKC39_12945 [Ferruginibacter sp.]|nr:hypothetical protein [Ferruginibacter sp.]HMP21859.1 hypothetical protein [Ferruginibacter sp.]
MDSALGIKVEASMAGYRKRIAAEWQAMQSTLAAKRKAEYEEWVRSQPVQKTNTGGSSLFTSKWQGFTYTPETTRRFKQAMHSSNTKEQLRQYKNYLNSRVGRRF